MTITDWQNCYEDGWKDAIVPEAFAHPAKFSRSLIVRIIRHGLDQGYWKPGDLLGDPFGGVALGGIIAGYHGLNWLGVELEPRFVDLGNQNLAMHGPRWLALGEATSVRLVQGDSRRFAEIVGEVAGVVSSPPYAEAVPDRDRCSESAWEKEATFKQGKTRGLHSVDGYGQTPGQIGSLPAGQLDAVVSSPPYADGIGHGGSQSPTMQKIFEGRTGSEEIMRGTRQDAYGSTPGQIGALHAGAVDACVTSPPYEGTRFDGGEESLKKPQGFSKGYSADGGYAANSPGQIGEAVGETYWQAMRQVYSQMHLALKAGGVAVPDDPTIDFCEGHQ